MPGYIFLLFTLIPIWLTFIILYFLYGNTKRDRYTNDQRKLDAECEKLASMLEDQQDLQQTKRNNIDVKNSLTKTIHSNASGI